MFVKYYTMCCRTTQFQVLVGSQYAGEVLITGGMNWDMTGRKQLPKGGEITLRKLFHAIYRDFFQL